MIFTPYTKYKIRNTKYNSGFTLIELLVVIAIIGVLASIVFASVQGVREKARIARAKADLTELRKAIYVLENDNNQGPNHIPLDPCNDPLLPTFAYGEEIFLDELRAGLQATDGDFPYWSGPYIPRVPRDPWGQRYIFDPDYQCNPSFPAGCEGIPPTIEDARAIHSGGPNKSGFNGYDADNVVLVLCYTP